MIKFKKRCFKCGKSFDRLYENQCEYCLKEEFPPIKEIKPIKLKIDNMSGKISYNKNYYSQEKFLKFLPKLVKKNLVLNEHYVLNDFSLENVQIKGHKLVFDVVVDCDLK